MAITRLALPIRVLRAVPGIARSTSESKAERLASRPESGCVRPLSMQLGPMAITLALAAAEEFGRRGRFTQPCASKRGTSPLASSQLPR